MRVNEIKAAIENVRSILAAGGASAAERDLSKLVKLLAEQGDRDHDEYVAEVQATLASGGKPDLNAIAARLAAAGDSEAAFKTVLAEIESSTAIKKAEALDIAKSYGVVRINERSKASIIESIDKHFYWMLYQRDADAMAKRATPW